MTDPSLVPGKSLESDLRLIREARGLSREDIFKRVHIRPEVLAQVEEHGFGATPTLNSDIHRRSFVKHYADAVEIDAQIALSSLQKSLTGFYDGSLAVAYLGLEELKSVPRWAQQSEETPIDADVPSDVTALTTDFDVAPNEPELPEFDLPVADQTDVFPAPEVEPAGEPEPKLESTPVEPEPKLESTPVEPEPKLESTPVEPEPLPDTMPSVPEPVLNTTPGEPEPVLEAKPAAPEPDLEQGDELDNQEEEAPTVDTPPEIGAIHASPYAPPILTHGPGSPPAPAPESPKPSAPLERPIFEPIVPAVNKATGQPEASEIPSSTLKESVIGPPEEDDFGDAESFLTRLRGQHWLGWLGLAGVVAVLVIVLGQSIFGPKTKEITSPGVVRGVSELPDQFSGIVRISPTTERFVTLQLAPDSVSPTDFVYRIWTHAAGSTYAETGRGQLNFDQRQILFDEPYGVGGLFIQDGGEVRLRSVRRIRFPRWEFTGQKE